MRGARPLHRGQSFAMTAGDILRLMEQDDAVLIREYESGDTVCRGQVSDVPSEVKLWKVRTIIASSSEYRGWEARIEIEASDTKAIKNVLLFNRVTRWVTRALQRAGQLVTEIGGGR